MTSRPRRNRVTPTGEIVAIPAKGRMMGNRGSLIDERGNIVREYGHKRWICCTLEEVNGRKVRFDDPDGYTPLFFTDEAVAFAAGFRPCGSCRPDDYYRFLAIWKRVAGVSRFERVFAYRMDQDLHQRRLQGGLFSKPVTLGDLPQGCFAIVPSLSSYPALLWGGLLWPWEEGGYGAPIDAGEALRGAQAVPMHGVEFLEAGFRFAPEYWPQVPVP
jgi:hypothetical protein